jgi:hypothetical protein
MSNETTTKKRELKPVEVGVGAAAAVITAFASSYFGTAGTLSGAALASVVGTVSTSVLRSSADRSAERLRQTTARLKETRTGGIPRPTDTRPVEGPADDLDPYGTHLFGAPDPGVTGVPAAQGAAEVAADRSEAPADGGRRSVRPRWVVLAAGATIAFATALVLITGIESAAGKPLAALVGRESGGGTTLGRATGSDSGSSSNQDTTPSPSVTPTSGSSPSPSQAPNGSPTGEPSATTPAPSPSATTPAPATPSATQPVPTQAPSNAP